MKRMWNNTSRKDKILFILLIVILASAGVYFGSKSLNETKAALTKENERLYSEHSILVDIRKTTPRLEKSIERNLKTIGYKLDRVQDSYDTPISFEKMFLNWLQGKRVLVNSFSAAGPSFENALIKEEQEKPKSILEKHIGVLAGEEPVEEPEDKLSKNKDKDKLEAKEGVDYSIEVWSYNYNIEMSERDYLEIMDKLNEKSEFYYLESSSYNYSSKSAELMIKVYSYIKPEQFKKYEDLSYFYYRVIRPAIEVPVEPSVPSEPGNPGNPGSSGGEGTKDGPSISVPKVPTRPVKPSVPKDEGLINNQGVNIYDDK